MVFTSYIFIFVFLPLVLIAHYFSPKGLRNFMLVVASYIFYGFWRFDFTLLLAASTIVNFVCARSIRRSNEQTLRTCYLILAIGFDLGILAYFKYFNFGMENLNSLAVSLGFNSLSWEKVILPLGISFFTFQSVSYVIDVYRNKVLPCDNLITFASYIALFPQLVAGPIVRYESIASELRDRKCTLGLFNQGALLFMIGFNKKVLLANHLGIVADQVFAMESPDMANAWLGLTSYSLQLYFDFSGYSDMAVGLGYMLGFRFPMNFNSPYLSVSITDFWRRWHMSLSSWLRDYLYVPLGGNRKGSMRTYFNLFVTMLLGGLWHGAAWTFVFWGGYHGLLLALERLNGKKPLLYDSLWAPFRVMVTFVLVMFGWVFFRSDSLSQAYNFFIGLFSVSTLSCVALFDTAVSPFFVTAYLCAFAVVFFGRHSWKLVEDMRSPTKYLHAGLFVVAIHELHTQGYNPFLYFQF